MLKLLKYISVFLITVCLLFACHASAPTEVKRPPLKVEFTSFVGEHSGIIAQEKGFFKAQGVDVELIYKRYIQLEIANFSAGKYDCIISSLGSFIILSATNPDIQGVMVVDESTGADVIVAPITN